MNDSPDPNGSVASPALVQDVFLTDVFLIKGRLANKNKRLSNVLEDSTRSFLAVRDATLVSLRNDEVIRTPTVMVNVGELILAHELVDVAGDAALQRLADAADKRSRIRAFYNGSIQFEIGGMVKPGAYEAQPVTGRKYFIMMQPVVRGLDLRRPELALLKKLDYAILRRDRMAYVYDFG